MPKHINGFDRFDDFQRASFYKKRIQRVTSTFDADILFLSRRYVGQESFYFWDTGFERLRGEASDLEKRSNIAYDEILLLYRFDTTITPTPCYFRDGPKEGQQLSNCQINQLYAITATTVDALKLSNTVKVYLGIFVLRDPILKKKFIQLFLELQSWPIVEGETLESQLFREMALIANPHLKGLFSETLNQLSPILEKRLREYEDCSPFGSRKCLACGETFENKVLAPFTLPNAEKKTEVRRLFYTVLREVFYQTLVDCLTRVEFD